MNYGVESAHPLKKDGGYYLVIVPKNGIINTSTEIDKGMAKDKFLRQKYTNGIPRTEIMLFHEIEDGRIVRMETNTSPKKMYSTSFRVVN